MSENAPSPEKKFSPEQEKLISTARELLTLPDAVESGPYYTYRPTTREEKLKFVVSKILRKAQPGNRPKDYDPLFDTRATKVTRKIVGIRGLTRPDLHEGGWGGGVYIKEELVEQLDTGIIEEQLDVYAEQSVSAGGGASEMSAYKNEYPWRVNLLETIDDPAEIIRLQLDFSARLSESAE